MLQEDLIFRALSDPTRRQILRMLRNGERAVMDLRPAFSMTKSAVSQHLRILREAGLVRQRIIGRQRFYRLRREPLKVISGYIESLSDTAAPEPLMAIRSA